MKFLCDQMLGTLATWLRLLGFDTYYAQQETKDQELLTIAKNNNRVLLTRDKQLIQRAKKENIKNIEITSTELDEQLQHVVTSTSLEIDNPLSRCSICNTPIHPIKKEKIQEKVPPKVFRYNNQFWHCPTCGKIYWKGSHWKKIQKKVKKLRSITSQKKQL